MPVNETDVTTQRSSGLTESRSKVDHQSASSILMIKHSEETSEGIADVTPVPIDTVAEKLTGTLVANASPNHRQSTRKATTYQLLIVSNIV